MPSLHQAAPELFPVRAQPEVTIRLPNLWDGVDDNNDLCVFISEASVLDDIGAMVATPFPPSPNFVDINGDGLPDLVVGDGYGFVWIYINSGEKGKPKFTTAEFLPTFIGWHSRLHVADWNQNGLYDLVIGTHVGEVIIMENTGTRQNYQFTRGMGIPRYISPLRTFASDPRIRLPQLRLGKDPMVLGIFMAPWVADWNGNQRPDLILGEGTYSANSVRIAFNRGSRGRPAFVEDSLFFLAYGEGAEQLTPAVVDYNGDGINDLMVGTRTGQIQLYKGSKDTVDPKDLVASLRSSLAPAALELDGVLQIGGKQIWDTMTYIHPCDWNENGLFDLLLGSTSGKIFIALNEGTKTEPKFPRAVPVKGTNVEKDLLQPTLWRANSFAGPCNTAVLLSSEEQVVLPTGGNPVTPTAGQRFLYFRYVNNYLGWNEEYDKVTERHTGRFITGARSISLPNIAISLQIGKRYEFSFDSILRGRPVDWNMSGRELVSLATDTAADSNVPRNFGNTVRPSGGWQKQSYTFTTPGLGRHVTNINFYLSFSLGEGDTTLMLDNFSLKEVRR